MLIDHTFVTPTIQSGVYKLAPQRWRVNLHTQAPSGEGGAGHLCVAMAMMQAFCTIPAAPGLWAAWEGRKVAPGQSRKAALARANAVWEAMGRLILARIFMHWASSYG